MYIPGKFNIAENIQETFSRYADTIEMMQNHREAIEHMRGKSINTIFLQYS